MSKVTYENSKHLIDRMEYQYLTTDKGMDFPNSLEGDILKVCYQKLLSLKPPTFDEVVKAWEDTIDDRLEFKNNDEGIRIIYPNGIYYLINREQVYSNRKVFSMNVNATLYAINLTVEYLKNRQIIESDKATK